MNPYSFYEVQDGRVFRPSFTQARIARINNYQPAHPYYDLHYSRDQLDSRNSNEQENLSLWGRFTSTVNEGIDRIKNFFSSIFSSQSSTHQQLPPNMTVRSADLPFNHTNYLRYEGLNGRMIHHKQIMKPRFDESIYQRQQAAAKKGFSKKLLCTIIWVSAVFIRFVGLKHAFRKKEPRRCRDSKFLSQYSETGNYDNEDEDESCIEPICKTLFVYFISNIFGDI